MEKRFVVLLIPIFVLSACQSSIENSLSSDETSISSGNNTDSSYFDTSSPVPSETFTITWLNYDGSVLEIDIDVPYGEMPTYDGKEPTREDDSKFSYVFSGWSPEVTKAVNDATYIAQFDTIEPYIQLIVPTSDVYVGDVVQLTYESKSLDINSFAWESSNTSVATISSTGLLTALQEGTVTITLSNGRFSDSIEIDIDYAPLDGFLFDFDGSSYTVSKYTGQDKTISIPRTYDGYPVTGIAGGAFLNCGLSSVFIPSTIIKIEANAFFNAGGPTLYCEVAEKPDGWDAIWNSSNCIVRWNSYKGIYGDYNDFSFAAYNDEDGKPYLSITKYNGGVNSSVEIPTEIEVNGEEIIVKQIGGDENIANGSFYNNQTILELFIPHTVISIGANAFRNCANLTTITFGENSQLKTIGEYAFYVLFMTVFR